MSLESLSTARIAVLQEQIHALKEGIAHQAKEYERRLSDFNHSYQKQSDRDSHYVSRESWELRNTELEKWRREVDQWRWVSAGAGLAGGGLAALIIRILGGAN